MDGATMHIQFEGDSRAFDANHPICGTINIQADRSIPAYGIQLKLEMVDMSKEVDHGDKGQRYEHIWRRRVWEKTEMINLPNNILEMGSSNVPFTFQVPADLPQSLYFVERVMEFRIKLRYFFKAQIVPVQTDSLNTPYGKSQLRDRQRVHVCPVRPIVNDPQFNVVVPFEKKVGLMGSKKAHMEVTLSKNFYLAGEMAYLAVNINNTMCSDGCNLIIAHKTKCKMYQNWRKYNVTRTNRKETFVLAGAGEQKSMMLQFQIASKRASPQGPGFFGNHAGDYHYVNSLVPESMFAQTFSVQNYLEIYLSHDNTTFSNDSTKRFYFQLIQHSLVPGVVEPPPPIFYDSMGQLMNMEAPVVGVPDGEVVQGENMDVAADNEKVKAAKDQAAEEEPEVSGAVQQR